jgi:hypothetical protein
MNVRERASSKDLVVSRIPALFNLRALKQLALAALMAFTVLIFGGEAAYAAGPPPSVNCTNGQTPNMTIVIYNNSKLHQSCPKQPEVNKEGSPPIIDPAPTIFLTELFGCRIPNRRAKRWYWQ